MALNECGEVDDVALPIDDRADYVERPKLIDELRPNRG